LNAEKEDVFKLKYNNNSSGSKKRKGGPSGQRGEFVW
jgi:hypothetical protein